jgi:hypothetical protein
MNATPSENAGAFLSPGTLETDGLSTTRAIKVKLEGMDQDAQVFEVREGDSY